MSGDDRIRLAGPANRTGFHRRVKATLNRRFLRRLLLFVIGIVLVFQLGLLARVWWWVDHNPASSAFMDARLSALQEKDPAARLQQQWVSYDDISPDLRRAVLAAEDVYFLEHNGFDWDGIRTAWEKNRKAGKVVAGGSTVSQQLAKNLFLSGERTVWRKAEEAAITLMLEGLMDKRRILEIYLNVVEWGDGVFGAEAAARHYYGVSARDVGPEQAARMAAMLPDPRHYDQNREARALDRNAAIIQRRMEFTYIPR